MSAHLEAQVRSLQSQLARMRRTQTAVALAFLAIGLVAAARKPGLVQAQRLELVDANGQVGAVFATEPGGTTLRMVGTDGAIVDLRAYDGQTDLLMRTEGASSGAAIALFADGSTSKFHLADPAGNPRVALGTAGDDVWVRTVDASGQIRTELGKPPATAAP
jgi:hypothetical protein